MKMKLLICSLLLITGSIIAQDLKPVQTIYQYKVPALDGGSIDFSKYKGKKILIVNTASMCGYTPQYKELEELSKKYKDKLVVIGFPSDNFGGQEYGSDKEVKEFCQKNYGVTFPLTTRVDVTGDKMIPVYKFLTSKAANGVLDASVKWNFNKFLVDEKGKVVAYYPSKVKPMGEEITEWLSK